jgi:hypothetical protein
MIKKSWAFEFFGNTIRLTQHYLTQKQNLSHGRILKLKLSPNVMKMWGRGYILGSFLHVDMGKKINGVGKGFGGSIQSLNTN